MNIIMDMVYEYYRGMESALRKEKLDELILDIEFYRDTVEEFCTDCDEDYPDVGVCCIYKVPLCQTCFRIRQGI